VKLTAYIPSQLVLVYVPRACRRLLGIFYQEEHGKAKSKQVHQAQKGTRAHAESEGKNGETTGPEE